MICLPLGLRAKLRGPVPRRWTGHVSSSSEDLKVRHCVQRGLGRGWLRQLENGGGWRHRGPHTVEVEGSLGVGGSKHRLIPHCSLGDLSVNLHFLSPYHMDRY